MVVCAHSPKAAKPNQVPPSGETTGVTEEEATYEGIAKQHKSGEKPQPDQPTALPTLIPLLAQGAPEIEPFVTNCAFAKKEIKNNISNALKRMMYKTSIFDKSNESDCEYQYA